MSGFWEARRVMVGVGRFLGRQVVARLEVAGAIAPVETLITEVAAGYGLVKFAAVAVSVDRDLTAALP